MAVFNILCSILIIIVQYECLGVHGLYNRYGFEYIEKCDDVRELYLIGQQTVQISREESLLVVGMCTSATSAPTADLQLESLLVNITQLQVYDISAWPPLPENEIQRIEMTNVKPTGGFGSCSKLTFLDVKSSNANYSVPADWLANCSRPMVLHLRHILVARARDIIDTVQHVDELILDAIPDWPTVVRNPIFPTPRNREQSITKINLVDHFYRYKWNEELVARNLNTTWTEVSTAMVEQVSLMPKLEQLFFSRIEQFDFCPSGSVSSDVLKNLYVVFQFKELSSVQAPQLLVEAYRGNTEWVLIKFIFDEQDYYNLSNGTHKGNVTLTLLRQGVDCDCQNAWLARAMREGLLTAPGLVCRDGRQLQALLPEWLECDRVACIARCDCRRDWRRDVLVADCHEGDFTSLPEELQLWPNITDLLLPGSRLKFIPENLPRNIQLLDLSDNAIWQLKEAELTALFAIEKRRVKLAGNPIVCTCDNRLMLDTLRIHRHQVEDYDRILCVGDNSKLKNANVTKLCESRDRETALAEQREFNLVIAVTAAVVIAAIALMLAVIFYYRRNISIFLFARGWCLSCLSEEDLDAECRYDIFVSYCHEDHDFVHNDILPVLEKDYTVCEHTRDFNPGAMIPAQIMVAVESSKRTMVILSKKFVKSLWGILEFRTAYATGLSAGCVRVVMVVLDDVLESSDLHAELRAYVSLNTYVRWGDLWFWDKLRYALPHSHSSPPECSTSHTAPRPTYAQQREYQQQISMLAVEYNIQLRSSS